MASNLPVEITYSSLGLHEIDMAQKLALAARVVTNSAVDMSTKNQISEFADRLGTVGAQAAYNTFIAKSTPVEQRDAFFKVAMEATTTQHHETHLTNSDTLRQFTLEASIRSCAAMLVNNKTVEILVKVPSNRSSNYGVDVQADLLASAVTIATSISKTAAVALSALL
eukprot:TRINITY_DN15038_c0_g1_i1.p1 TRINITY_DN15038_c0_g1~~TRINITY_DN15038_c0_g1_i1.p1  ORF type:complete len:189 (-),score=18.61 TRINITY_DN15038_c0_g1_i1:8-511(-)